MGNFIQGYCKRGDIFYLILLKYKVENFLRKRGVYVKIVAQPPGHKIQILKDIRREID